MSLFRWLRSDDDDDGDQGCNYHHWSDWKEYDWADINAELPKQHPTSNEVLAELGREDPECEVTLTGYET